MQTYAIEALVERGRRLQKWSGGAMENLSGKLDLPTDLCEWVSPGTLMSWVQEEISKLNGSGPGNGFPKPLLAILAFAYARGIFDSEEVVRACDSVAEFKKLAAGGAFTPEQLRNVRHRERGLLVTITVRLLTRAVSARCEVTAAQFSPELKRRLHENAVSRLDNAILIDRIV